MTLEQLGRYEIIEELGHGSMGVVYKARDPLLDRVVALKTVALDSSQEADDFERLFYREARSAGRLNHTNIVTIHDVGKGESVAYIAMEFLQGRSLREILDSGVVLPIDRIIDIATQVAEGLSFAHENGIVHRDIKPPNIMILDNGVVKITDFGIALLPTGARTLAGRVFGSPKYMSPEQVVGRQVDGRADVFSLGAVVYEMLTGFAPFFGGDLEALLYQVINEMPPAPSTRKRTIPPVFDTILAKALAKHPDDRYPSARAFAGDLRNFRELKHVPPLAVQRTLERRMVRRRKGRIDPPAATGEASAAASRPPVVRPAGFPLRTTILIAVPAVALFIAGGAFLVRVVSNRLPSPTSSAAQLTAPSPASSSPVAVSTTSVSRPQQVLTDSGATAPPKLSLANATVPEPSEHDAPKLDGAPERLAEAPATVKPMGRLSLAVSPWGEVYVDGKKRGLSPPLTEIKLPPGTHTIEIRNTTFAPYAGTVNVGAEASVKVRHRFQ